MPVQAHLVTRLREMYELKHDLRSYVLSWDERIASPAVAAQVRQSAPVLEAQLARLVRCLDRLGAIAPEEMASPLVDALRWGDTAALAEIPHATPLDRSIRFVVTALAVGGLATSMTEGMLAMAETLALPEIIDQLRMNLAQDEQDLIAMHALLESLLADASSGRMRPAA